VYSYSIDVLCAQGEKCPLLQSNAAHPCRTSPDCIGEIFHRQDSFILCIQGHRQKRQESVVEQTGVFAINMSKVGEVNLLGTVGIVPGVRHRNV